MALTGRRRPERLPEMGACSATSPLVDGIPDPRFPITSALTQQPASAAREAEFRHARLIG
jgi:hypothetical protein